MYREVPPGSMNFHDPYIFFLSKNRGGTVPRFLDVRNPMDRVKDNNMSRKMWENVQDNVSKAQRVYGLEPTPQLRDDLYSILLRESGYDGDLDHWNMDVKSVRPISAKQIYAPHVIHPDPEVMAEIFRSKLMRALAGGS